MFYIGIDVGTSAVKLLLMNEDGRIERIVSKEYPIYYPKPGWSEQNPEDWYTQTIAGLKELISGIDKKEVAGIGFGGQMHGLVVLDENDNVIRPTILWNDSRTADETVYLNKVIGEERLSEYTGNIAFAGFTAPKILWMRKHEPDNYKRISKIMLPKDYIVYRLTGVHASDPSDASGTLFYDVKNKCWSEEMMKICGLKEEQLPAVYQSYDVVGTIKEDICTELGFIKDVKVVAGAGDNAAAAVGTGTVGEGSCNVSLGTSGTIFIPSSEFKADRNSALHFFAHAAGNYHLMGVVLSAASCNKWWMEDILMTSDFAREQESISNLGKNRVYFLPYLMGERSPHNDPDARGAFIGLTMETTRKDMTLAMMEGVAFAIRDSYEVAKSLGINIEKTKMCGGGAKSHLWRRILSNVLNLKVEIPEVEEGPAMGGAMLAAVGCGEYESVEDIAQKIVRVKETVEPDPEIALLYNERYEIFRRIYPCMKDLFKAMRT
ncbi:MAG TPA: xylulokinase [Clostridiales bacterium]|nr:xylulokinase [Clostridiales bacterium]